ncbi:MAG TPA: DUF2207 domain-containing protein [Frankiaceae bacterium]|nr:DUF2207 domain-containing protein [Frankiaceae bacterium]
MTRVLRALAALAVAAASMAPGSASAQLEGFERIRRYDVRLDLARSGRLRVVETIDYSFGVAPKRGIFRTIPVRFRYDETHDRIYPLGGLRVTSPTGAPTETQVTDEGGSKKIRIGDPDRTITGDHTYVIAYDVDGAVNRFEGHDELFWNAIGHEWFVLVERVSVTLRTEGGTVSAVACYAGPQGSLTPCRTSRATGTSATYGHGLLSPTNGVSVVAALPHGYAAAPGPVLKERWTFRKAFSTEAGPLGLAVAVLVASLGTLVVLVSRRGRDRYYSGLTPGLEPAAGETFPEEPLPLTGRGEVSVDFTPGADMRPALMGVLVDERADPLDVTATIVDLAVRRHLTIEELPRQGLFGRRDWRLTRLDGPDERLRPWESGLIMALFRTGDVVLMSDLKNEFADDLRTIQGQLYDEVVARGWFTRRPDEVRGKWGGIAKALVVVAGIATYALARFTTFGLTGVALVLAALALLVLSPRLPFRTGRGTAALDRARAFRRYLVTAEVEQLRAEERAGIFARYLPYAVVMGEAERWAKAFADLGAQQQDLYWYSGPAGWSPMHIGDSITSFSSTTAGTIASTPGGVGGSSGFSGGGGGGSGGGGGGGGGGSW